MLRTRVGEVDDEWFETDNAGRSLGHFLRRGITGRSCGRLAKRKKRGGAASTEQQDDDNKHDEQLALAARLFGGLGGRIGWCLFFVCHVHLDVRRNGRSPRETMASDMPRVFRPIFEVLL